MIAFAEADNFKKKLMDELKSERRNTSTTDVGITQRGYNKPKKKSNGLSNYEKFLKKCEDFENNAPKFNAVDLVFYMRKVSEECGHGIYISNMARDASLMKKLKTQYGSVDVCAMIEFLYHSEQDYLEKNRITVSTLCSRWATTIHEDTMLWVEDKYTPRKNKSGAKKKLKGEWDGDAPTEDNRKTKIGEW